MGIGSHAAGDLQPRRHSASFLWMTPSQGCPGREMKCPGLIELSSVHFRDTAGLGANFC